jgi:hypothetical protein
MTDEYAASLEWQMVGETELSREQPAPLSTTNSASTTIGLKSCLRGYKRENNRMRYATVFYYVKIKFSFVMKSYVEKFIGLSVRLTTVVTIWTR